MRFSLAAVFLLLAACRTAAPPRPPWPFLDVQREIRVDIATGSCRYINGVTAVSFWMAQLTASEEAYVHQCWAAAQRELVSYARAKGDCDSVSVLPGTYPRGSDEDRRYVIHCWLEHGGGADDLDACIEIGEIGNATSLLPIEAALKRNPPSCDDGGCQMFDTNVACRSAYQSFARVSDDEFLERAKSWGPEWQRFASERRRPAPN
jgi:hypothetical protein